MGLIVNKLDLILSSVVGITTVDADFLLEDNEFRKLLVGMGNKMTMSDAIDRLVNYVNENY